MASFDSLSTRLQQRIDRAFDTAGNEGMSNNDVTMGGGFIPEEPLGGGGFIRDDEDLGGGGFIRDEQARTRISLSNIPIALQTLDLPPDDEQVLSVFRNAASGWTASSSDQLDDSGGGWVSREDWRSVCAVLLEDSQEDSDSALMQQDSDASDDQYLDVEDDDDQNDDDSEDDYVEGLASTNRHRTHGHRPAESQSASPPPERLTKSKRKLTKRQEEATLEAFALFFPNVPPEEVPQQKIMIKDIQRVAKLLGEKIKAEEMIEMLDAFSSAPDKSVSLEDFGRIMVAARLA